MPRPGDIVTVEVTAAASFHLIADSVDGRALNIRRTPAGDAWDRAEAASCAVPSETPRGSSVSLGLPTLRVVTAPIYDITDGLR